MEAKSAAPSVTLLGLDASAIAALVQARDVSAREVTEAHIGRIEETHAQINAVVLPLFSDARKRADALDRNLGRGVPAGPLAGVPVTIKDQVRVAGAPTTFALASRRDLVDQEEGPLVRRLREAGAIVLGKTNVPQILFGFETDNALFGRTNNPWAQDRAPAASSGGEAANLAVGGAALGLGGDLGGSVRLPAHATGLFGLRPTSGRLSLLDSPPGVFAPLPGIVPQMGPLARSARDLALAMQVLVRPLEDRHDATITALGPVPDPSAVDLSTLRVGVCEDDGYFSASPAVRRAVREAAEVFQDRGVTLEIVPSLPTGRAMEITMGLLSSDGGDNLRNLLGTNTADKKLAATLQGMGAPRALLFVLGQLLRWKGDPRTAALMGVLGRKTTRELALLLGERQTFQQAFQDTMARQALDAVLCPPMATVAARHDAPDAAMLTAGCAFLFTLLEMPAGVAPVTRVRPGEETDRPTLDPAERNVAAHERGSAGLPVGVQVAAHRMREDVVLALLQALDVGCRGKPDYPTTPIDPR
jgi:fatty acid amide hydrolase